MPVSNQSTEHVRIHFDAVVLRYDEFAFLQDLAAKELLQRLDLLQLEIKTVLDLGAGTGLKLSALRKCFPKSQHILLDHSQMMLDLAKKKLSWKQRLLKTVSLLCAPAVDTRLEDESVDICISNLLLPYIGEHEGIFSEVQRVMRADGVFCFTSFGPDTLQEMQEILVSLNSKSYPNQAQSSNNQLVIEEQLHIGHLVDMHLIGDSLLKAGFREPVMDVDHVTLSFSTFDALWDELFYTGVIYGSYESAIKEQIRIKYESYRNKEGDLPVSFEIIYGQAWANSNQSIREKAEFQRDGVFNFPIEQLKRR